MAGSPAEVIAGLQAAQVVGVLRAPSAEAAYHAACAAQAGGLRATEFTFTTPGAAAALTRFRSHAPEMLVGAGTVLTAAQAREALEAGADFLVSPHLGEDVLEVAQAAGAAYLPGVLTPSEVGRALNLGAAAVKLFPAAAVGGASYLRDLRGPWPELAAMVTGGISPGEVGAYLRAGALAVGLGSQLFARAALEAGDWTEVEAATRRALAAAC